MKDRPREVVLEELRQKASLLPGTSVTIGQPISHRINQGIQMSDFVVVSMTMRHDATLERPSRLPLESMLNDAFATHGLGAA